MNISMYDSNSISMLFSSMSTTSRNNNNASDLFQNGFTNMLGDYAMIRKGTYGKLLKAYYNLEKENDDDKKTSNKVDKDKGTDRDSSKELAKLKKAGDSLKEATNALSETGLYEKKVITDSEGNVAQDYDRDAIYKKLSSFVSSYNNAVDKAGDSNTSGVLIAGATMTAQTSENSKALAKIGVTVKSDNTLEINKEEFMKSDMEAVKKLFSGYGSYGKNISSKANAMSVAADTASKLTSMYNSNGTSTYKYQTGISISEYI